MDQVRFYFPSFWCDCKCCKRFHVGDGAVQAVDQIFQRIASFSYWRCAHSLLSSSNVPFVQTNLESFVTEFKQCTQSVLKIFLLQCHKKCVERRPIAANRVGLRRWFVFAACRPPSLDASLLFGTEFLFLNFL